MTTAILGSEGATALKARVVVTTGSAADLQGLIRSLGQMGHEVQQVGDAAEAARLAATDASDLMLVDAAMAASFPSSCPCPALLVGDGASAQSSAFLAAIPRSAGPELLEPLIALATALGQTQRLARELQSLTAGMRDGSAIVGRSPTIRRLQGALRRAADCEATLLVEGPPGCGKSLAARLVHCRSRRGNQPITVLPAGQIDAEGLPALLQAAQATTVVIEDVDQLSAPSQAILVRHLKERSTQPGGRSQPRIIATTSAHLPELVARGAFREDLYYRLHAFPVQVPALRERIEDIPLLASSILESCSAENGQRHVGLTASALMLIESMPWPGNVAQLEQVVRRAWVLAGGGPIDRQHIAGVVAAGGSTASTGSAARSRDPVEDAGEPTEDAIRPFEQEEQRILTQALRATRGNVRRAAQLLGIGRATLYRKIQQYRLRLH